MTPDALTALIREFGLPLGMLVVFAWMILKRKLVTGAELDEMRALFERERTDRIGAQSDVARSASANAELAEAVKDLSQTVARDPYTERQEGRRRGG